VTALLDPATSYTVDPWDPGYGVASDLEERASTAELELDAELPAASWRPISPSTAAPLPSAVLFLDGVRRIDARVWVHSDSPAPTNGSAPTDGGAPANGGAPVDGSAAANGGTPANGGAPVNGSAAANGGTLANGWPVPAVAASLAAGLVCCTPGAAATIIGVRVDRGLYSAVPDAPPLITRHGTYTPQRAGAGPDELSLAVQRRLAELEVELAESWRATASHDDDLLIVDGPLRGRTHLPRTVGYVKTHHTAYLPDEPSRIVAALGPGQRTPVFVMGTSWRRHSWYLRLPAAAATPWSGIVRLECSADLPVPEAITLADLTARLLPGLASTPHKDPRAPQNLVPIGGLERQLRHRLGDAALLYRALRTAGTR
jgi:hypothetical protein